MNIDLALAKREYILSNGITDREIILKTSLIHRGVNKQNEAVFDVYTPGESIPLGWALKKLDVKVYDGWEFPKNTPITPITVVNFINGITGKSMVPDDIAFITTTDTSKIQVMMSLDSMYFTNTFILKTA